MGSRVPRVFASLPGLCLGQPWVGQSGDGCISVACGDVCSARIKGDRGVADLDRDRLDGRLSAAQLCRCAVLACGDISALRSRARAGLTRSSRCASCEGSSRVAERNRSGNLFERYCPEHLVIRRSAGFYYILFVARSCYILFIARSLGSTYQRHHPSNRSYAWPRHSCNHFGVRSWPTHRSSLV